MANVYDDHPHLHHYTDLPGLMGILETQTLWATHYKSLNDFSEIKHMRTELEGRVSKMFEEALAEKVAAIEARRIYVENQGGIEKVSCRAAKGLIQARITRPPSAVLTMVSPRSVSRT